VPGYLASRGTGADPQRTRRVGYGPAARAALLDHLRDLGHGDAAIEASGLARRSPRGTLIDTFRDRAMLPIRTEDGQTAAFIGRARPRRPR
jgi:DNA primase